MIMTFSHSFVKVHSFSKIFEERILQTSYTFNGFDTSITSNLPTSTAQYELHIRNWIYHRKITIINCRLEINQKVDKRWIKLKIFVLKISIQMILFIIFISTYDSILKLTTLIKSTRALLLNHKTKRFVFLDKPYFLWIILFTSYPTILRIVR